MKTKITLFAVFLIVFSLSLALQPTVSTEVALNQVNGGEAEAIAVRNVDFVTRTIPILIFAGLSVLLFIKEIRNTMPKLFKFIVPVMLTAFFTGCKPYDTPEYIEIQSDETAFVIPLEGDTANQVAFESEEHLNKQKVATKRIRITKRWDQRGRIPIHGAWIPNIRVITVDREPVTRQWIKTTDGNNDSAIWLESEDSVGFSTGFTCTAMIKEEDAAKFLYRYTSGNDLSRLMDTEIRARVQSKASEISAKYKMDELRTKKNEIILAVREDVVPFFSERGVTITTLGMYGGFTYENKKVQEAIDGVFVAQQEKEVAAAQLAAQRDKNLRLEQEGIGLAKKMKEEAVGRAEAIELEANAQAEALRVVASATKEANSDPTFLEIKRLEVLSEQMAKWDGKFPQTFMGGNPSMLLNMSMSK